jgi:hypothetical protein
MEPIAAHEVCDAADVDERAVGKLAPRSNVHALAPALETLGVKSRVECVGANDAGRGLVAEKIAAPAERARAVTCSKR